MSRTAFHGTFRDWNAVAKTKTTDGTDATDGFRFGNAWRMSLLAVVAAYRGKLKPRKTPKFTKKKELRIERLAS